MTSGLCLNHWMAIPAQVELLKQGAESWNAWRREHPDETVDLSDDVFRGCEMRGADLSKANLANGDLSDSDLSEVDLSDAILVGAKARGANLRYARLNRADMQQIDFAGADLSFADLADANIRHANLEGATGVLPRQLARADLSGVSLPADSDLENMLENVAELSRNARTIFLTMLAGCFYTWLTISTTTDVRLITNSTSSPLPILQAEIPIVGFFYVAPILLLATYAYFHLYAQRLWLSLSTLPAVFPDGVRVDQKVYPWLLTGLVGSAFSRLEEDSRPALSRLEGLLSGLLAWWLVPMTQYFVWFRYLFRKDWIGTGFHVAVTTVTVLMALYFGWLAVRTLTGRTADAWVQSIRSRRNLFLGMIALGALAILLDQSRLTLPTYSNGYAYVADLDNADVSVRPEGWNESEFDRVKPADLVWANLRGARLRRSFLVRADLRWANLSGAQMQEADLREARLHKADLTDAWLPFADLRRARLSSVTLLGANLEKARLDGTELTGVVGLTCEQITKATWEDPPILSEKAIECFPHGDRRKLLVETRSKWRALLRERYGD